GVSKAALRLGPLTQRRFPAGPSRATGRPATVIVNSSPASARRSTSPTLLRSSFWGIVGIVQRGSSSATTFAHVRVAQLARRSPGAGARNREFVTAAAARRQAVKATLSPV